jgi:NAD(P)-dependent dehydrogenase (short-subunit alcohol dehydrogenase family)
MGKLQGKVAVVTGGTSGIGFATAKRFVDEGAYVFITGRRQKELDEAVKAIGSNAAGVRGDVSKLRDLDRLYETVKAKGKIDVLVANAGIGEFAPLASLTEEHFDKLFNLNVKGTLFTVQKALPVMNDAASIILVGSVASVKGTPAFGTYGATKAAVRNLVRAWTVELKDRRIRSNVLSDQDASGGSATTGNHREDANHHSDGTHGRAGRSRQGSGVPGLRRFQLCHGHRAICRRRPRSSLISGNSAADRPARTDGSRPRQAVLAGPSLYGGWRCV